MIMKFGKPNTRKGRGSNKLSFDYSKLRGKIREVYGTQEAFAKALGMSRSTLSIKLNDDSEFTRQEMAKAMALLNEPLEKVDQYFFALQVRKTE